ncbi:MAG: MBL fold metallo-hydrolase, partial [Oscillospiraceae bacterium]|nr:MBL fold metallo-hydrolase [Oscillospiraceae bacterium]
TNLLGLWAVSLCFCGGYLSCFAALLFLPLGKLIAVPTQLLARYLILLAGLICRIPHHLLPMQTAEMKGWLALCYALGLIAWRSRAGSRFRLLVPAALSILTLAAVISVSARRYRSAEAVLAALDVGQGECICAVSVDNTLMFDCGGLNTLDNAGETAGAWLEHAGRKQLDALVLSHLHEDHANGVPMLLELIPVREIILSPNADTDEQLLTRIVDAAERNGTKVTRLLENTERTFGKIRVRMTAPPDAGDENERCIISLVSIGDYDMLITGDSPVGAEQRLIENEEIPDTELLIVGHHGSKTSSDRTFLSAIQAEDAIISVGKNNSYGHPTRETLASLQICGYGIYRTDLNGTVEVWLQTA